jgi:hypothetical protein
VAHLQLPASASDGRHRDRQHLRSSYSALERLEDMPDVSCPWALRVSLLLSESSVNIGHRDSLRDSSWRGRTGIGTTVKSGLQIQLCILFSSRTSLAGTRPSTAKSAASQSLLGISDLFICCCWQHAYLGSYMQIQAYTCRYMPYMQIHAKFCTYVFGMYESLYVYVYFCRYIHIHTHKSMHIVCVCMYCMYVLSYLCAYLVHIVHMLCILYVFFAAKFVRRCIQTRYIQYIQIHTHMH